MSIGGSGDLRGDQPALTTNSAEHEGARGGARHGLDRRTVASGIAWSLPVVSVAAATPSAASTPPLPPPGIDGLIGTLYSRDDCTWSLRVQSDPAAPPPGGGPWGNYLYNVGDDAVITGVTLTYWIIGNNNVTWIALQNHSTCWVGPTRGTPAVKSGDTYTPYTWTYNCVPDPQDRESAPPGRLFLETFRMRTSVTQPSGLCDTLKVCTDRFALVDPDGAGSDPQVPVSQSACSPTAGPVAARQSKSLKSPNADKAAGEGKAKLEGILPS